MMYNASPLNFFLPLLRKDRWEWAKHKCQCCLKQNRDVCSATVFVDIYENFATFCAYIVYYIDFIKFYIIYLCFY